MAMPMTTIRSARTSATIARAMTSALVDDVSHDAVAGRHFVELHAVRSNTSGARELATLHWRRDTVTGLSLAGTRSKKKN